MRLARLFSLLLFALPMWAVIIPTDRRTTWQGNAGVSGGIPHYTAISATLTPSGDATTDTAAINAALNSASNQSVVFLKNGTFFINNIIDWGLVQNAVVLRGNGPHRTKLQFSAGKMFMRSAYCEECLTNAVNLSADAVQGSTTLLLTSVPSWIKVGNTYIVDQIDDETNATDFAGEDSNTYKKAIGYGVNKFERFPTDVALWSVGAGSVAGSTVAWTSADAQGSVSSGSMRLTGNFGAGAGQASAAYTFASPLNLTRDYTRFYFYLKVGSGNLTSGNDYGTVQVIFKTGAGLTAAPIQQSYTINSVDLGSNWRFINARILDCTNDLSDVRGLEIKLSASDYTGPVAVDMDEFYLVANRGMSTVVKIAAKTSTNVTVETPLLWAWQTNRTAQLSEAGYDPNLWQLKRCGVEDLTMEATYEAGDTSFFDMENTDECWVKNVAAFNQPGRMYVQTYWGYRCEIRDCYFFDSHHFGPGQGYGIDLYTSTANSLAENNIIKRSHFGLVGHYGGGGNVYGYNYCFAEFSDQTRQTPSMGTHGNTVMMDLFEGNYCESKFMADFVHGSATRDTIFRNRILGKGSNDENDADSTAISLEKWNRTMNVVGNVLGKAGVHTNYTLGADASYTLNIASICANEIKTIYKFGYPRNYACSYLVDDIVSDSPSVLSFLLHGNWDTANGAIVWDGSIADHALPNSLYLAAKPSWWDDAAPWPPVDPTATTTGNINAITIPAKLRYEREWVPPTYTKVRALGNPVGGQL